jgi:small subunit ribosomal protein S6
MSSAKHSYETTCIINSSLEDSQIEAAISHVAEVIERNGGAITATNRWGRKRMAYPIEKKNNGYYVNMEFTGPGQLIAQLERSYILDENILRFLTIQLDKHALAAKARSAAESAAAEAAKTAEPPRAAAEPAKPAEDPKAQKPPAAESARPPLFSEGN